MYRYLSPSALVAASHGPACHRKGCAQSEMHRDSHLLGCRPVSAWRAEQHRMGDRSTNEGCGQRRVVGELSAVLWDNSAALWEDHRLDLSSRLCTMLWILHPGFVAVVADVAVVALVCRIMLLPVPDGRSNQAPFTRFSRSALCSVFRLMACLTLSPAAMTIVIAAALASHFLSVAKRTIGIICGSCIANPV